MIARPITALAVCLPMLAGLPLAPARADPCGENVASNSGMAECRSYLLRQADVQLNAAYGRTLAILKTFDRGNSYPDAVRAAPALVAAQRAWITFRDRDCHIGNALAPGLGMIAPFTMGDCLIERTRERTRQLVEIGDAFQ